MSLLRTLASRVACLATVAVVLSVPVRAADAPAGMTLPKPGAEHAVLAKWVGTWTSMTTMSMGEQKISWTGSVETRPVCGGLWYVSDHTSTDPKMPFEGHEFVGYDPNAKKYVGSWVDSWTTSITPFDMEWNAETKQFRSVLTVKGPDGQPGQLVMLTEILDDDHHTSRMWMGSEQSGEPMMTMVYARAAVGPAGRTKATKTRSNIQNN